MTNRPGRATHVVTPNRRGVRSREAVLDGVERLIAQRGYNAATVAALVEEAGVPASSIYHYFDSKEGVVLAAMERGAERFLAGLPTPDAHAGSGLDHLRALLDAVAAALGHHPDFPRVLVVMAVQPPAAGGDLRRVVDRVRDLALGRLRREMHVAFGLDPAGAAADHLARFALAALVGAIVADQSNPAATLRDVLEDLPAALLAARRELGPPGGAAGR